MNNILLYFVCMLFVFSKASSQPKNESAVLKTLTNQQAAWNKGDIESYMQGYWQSDSLMFIGKSGITYGWKKTFENYKKSYPDTAAMGKLDFQFVDIKKLSATYYFVTGRWHLTRTVGNICGSFTLLLRKINGRWLIVKDHSS